MNETRETEKLEQSEMHRSWWGQVTRFYLKRVMDYHGQQLSQMQEEKKKVAGFWSLSVKVKAMEAVAEN